jgi:hypothetical protein
MSINTNPFSFTYENSKKKIKFYNDNARELRVINKQPGNYYLKCTYIVYFRSYNKYEDEPETQKMVTLHFSIPDDLRNDCGEIDLNLFDNNQNLKSSESAYFTTWKNDYESDECKYTELYVPQFIEWII